MFSRAQQERLAQAAGGSDGEFAEGTVPAANSPSPSAAGTPFLTRWGKGGRLVEMGAQRKWGRRQDGRKGSSTNIVLALGTANAKASPVQVLSYIQMDGWTDRQRKACSVLLPRPKRTCHLSQMVFIEGYKLKTCNQQQADKHYEDLKQQQKPSIGNCWCLKNEDLFIHTRPLVLISTF